MCQRSRCPGSYSSVDMSVNRITGSSSSIAVFKCSQTVSSGKVSSFTPQGQRSANLRERQSQVCYRSRDLGQNKLEAI